MSQLDLVAARIDLRTGKVLRSGRRGGTDLTDRERKLLAFLADHPGRTFDRDALQAGAWGIDRTGPSRAVDTAVRRIRSKIEADPARPDHLLTVHGVGYRFAPKDEVRPPTLPPVARPRAGIALGRWTVDLDHQVLVGPDARVALTTRETDVLALLLDRAPEPLTRAEAHARLWGVRRAGAHERHLDLVVHHLRRKLEERPAEPALLLTDARTGYRLVRAVSPSTRPPVPSNLGAPVDRWYGDRAVRDAVVDRIASGGWVTVTGPAGVGKTRLALEVADATRARWVGVWVAALADAGTRSVPVDAGTRSVPVDAGPVDAVGTAVAEAMGLPPSGVPRRRAVEEALSGRGPTLVVLDDADAVLAEVADAVGRWRAAAPRSGFLVTSRSAGAEMDGPEVIELGPLDPDAATALLVDRIEGQDPPWRWTPETREVVAAIARRLDGLPLALELAATRAAAVAPAKLLAQLDASARSLLHLGPRRSANPSHTSLGAALAVSWRGLSAAERSALGALSAFHGGFGLDGAAAVLGESAADLVAQLRQRAWLAPSLTVDVEPRYHLLNTVHAYVVEATPAAALAAARARHGAWCASLADAPLSVCVRERDNLGAALDRAAASDPDGVLLPTWRALTRAVMAAGPAAEVPRLLGLAARWPPTTDAGGTVHVEAARLAARFGRYTEAQGALDAARRAPDRADRRNTLDLLEGNLAVASRWDPVTARAAFGRVLADPHAPELLRQRARSGMVKVLRDEGHLDEARVLCAELASAGTVSAAHAWHDLGLIELAAGRPDDAEPWIRRALTATSDPYERLIVERTLARTAFERGDIAGAIAAFTALLERSRAHGTVDGRAQVACDLAGVLVEAGALDEVEAHVAFARGVLAPLGHVRAWIFGWVSIGQVAELRARPDDAVAAYGEVAAAAPGTPAAAVAHLFGAVALARRGRGDEAQRWLAAGARARADLVERAAARVEGRGPRLPDDAPRDAPVRWLSRTFPTLTPPGATR